MTLWSDLFNHRHLISRAYYMTPGVITLTSPARTAYARFSLNGAGCMSASSSVFGSGAAFARVKVAASPGDQFSLQIGDHAQALGSGNALGDSIVTKVTGSVVICKAVRGGPTAGGDAASCIGDVTRSGLAGGGGGGGSSAGDDADTYPLGFGGHGASEMGPSAAPGGGGANGFVLYTNGSGYTVTQMFPAGDGMICAEFFDQDPAILLPGY